VEVPKVQTAVDTIVGAGAFLDQYQQQVLPWKAGLLKPASACN
jgi:hypothetical protein